MMTRPLVTLFAVATLLAAAGCKKRNARYCDVHTPCPGDRTCNQDTNECGPPGTGGDGDSGVVVLDMAGGCSCGNTTPICHAPDCVACTSVAMGEAACALSYPTAPHCLTAEPGAGACVACRDASDCHDPAAPACDPAAHSCRPCNADSECASQICDLLPQNSTTFGHCVDASQIVYVDGVTIAKIQDGMTQAEQQKRPYVHIASGTYAENVYLDHPTSLFLVGAANALVHPAGGDAIGISGGGNLGVRGLIATAPGNGVNCQGATSKVSIYRSQLINSSQSGIVSNNCALTVDATWIDHNMATGVLVSGSFSITNSILTANSGQGALQQTGGGTTVTFTNNTVADNSVSLNAVGCLGGGLTLINSILYNNKTSSGGISETSCPVMYSAIDDKSMGATNVALSDTKAPGFALGPRSAAYYRLVPTSPCRDKGTANGAPDHDFDGNPRPDKHDFDIGAFEIQ
jgi:hypothetical protein